MSPTVPKVVTTKGLEIDLNDPEYLRLVHRAQAGDEADQQLTVGQALRKYKKAVAWAMFLSLTLVMEGYDLVIISSFYGQTQFRDRFGEFDPVTQSLQITPAWQSGLSNSALVGQIIGLAINGFAQERFGSRKTMMFFLMWMNPMIAIVVFAPSLAVLAVGEFLCGIAWGVFQTLSTAYACEVVPTVLRPYVTAFVCMCWGTGILISSGVVRAAVDIPGEMGYRLPFILQWMWPTPLLIGIFFAPESPWNCVRRGKTDEARASLTRLRTDTTTRTQDVEATLALITHTTAIENAETKGATYLECFRGTNLRRTEINCVVWSAQILCGNAILGFAVLFLQNAGFSEVQSFNVNISLSACYIVGGIISWFLLFRFGRATIYMCGLAGMLICLIIIGALGFVNSVQANLAVGIMLVVSTLINMITVGPICYPIVAETPSGRLRYKTIVIGRTVYNLTGIFSNSVTPRMVQAGAWGWGAKTAWFYGGTNLLCLIWCWFRLPESKDRSFGELDILFANKVPARKFRTTKADQFASFREAEKADADLMQREKLKVQAEHIERV